METAEWGRGAVLWRQYSRGEGHYHVDRTMRERVVTMETAQ